MKLIAVSGVFAVIEDAEEAVGQQRPYFAGVGPEFLAEAIAVQRALVVAHQLCADHHLVQNHQRQKVVLIEHLVEVVEVLCRVVWPRKCLGSPLHKIPFQGLQRRQANRTVGIDVFEGQQRAPQ